MHPAKHKAMALAKISRPRDNRPVLRPRLFQRLDDFRNASVIWIAAPPGAGKTTLISSYLAERRLASLWVQLDADDADLATFFHYLGLAVQQATARAGLMLPSLTPEYLPGLMSFTRRYAETIAAAIDSPTVIVLDNYELVPALAKFHEVVSELASALPDGLNLVVLSRTEPPPAYARLRLHQDLRVLDGLELNLTQDEAIALVATRASLPGTPSNAQRVDQLLLETKGWIGGFNLLLAEGSDRDASGLSGKTQQLLFDYFATELFGHFDPPIQGALLRTALLPVMALSDAEQISGAPAIGKVLAELHRQNCFVVQRGQVEPAYEFHALFRAFLLSRATAHIPADEWRALQCRAAALLAESKQTEAAAGLYRAAEDWQGLSALALREAPALIAAGRHLTLEHWLSDLPGGIYIQLPWLQYWQGAARLPFDPATARSIFEQAYAGFQIQDDVVGLYSTWSGAMESFFFEWRDFAPADHWIAEFESLRTRYPEFPSRAVELRTYWAMGTLLHRQPEHPLLPSWSERALVLLDPADRDLSVLLGGYLIIWFLWRGETPKAGSVIERIAPWTGADMAPMVFILWSCAVALYHSVQGDLESCRKSVEAGLALAGSTGLHAFDFLLAAQMARCSLVTGELAEADTWLAMMGKTMRSHSHLNGAFYRHFQSNAAAQRGDWQQALDHARSGMAMALESGVPFLEAHCHIELARALLGCGDGSEWAEHIDAARSIGQAMSSRVVDYLCLEAEATAAFKHGEEGLGRERLVQALALSHAMDGPTWLMAGPQASARLYECALAAGIEVDHVRRLIRRHRLMPPEPATAAESWPWPIRVYTLGRFEILCDDQPLHSSGKAQHKPLELLKCLCAFGGQAVNQDRVTDALWPDSDGDAAEQALRTTLHRLRKLLKHEQAVRLEDRHLHLDPLTLWADCLAFDRATHLPGMTDRVSMQRVLNRYRGAFLQGESAPWAVAFRERLRAQYMSMAERLGTLLEQDSDWLGAVDCYQRAIEVEPVAESFYRHLMNCYAKLGRRAEALAVYQRCRQALLARLGVSPTQETQTLYQLLADR